MPRGRRSAREGWVSPVYTVQNSSCNHRQTQVNNGRLQPDGGRGGGGVLLLLLWSLKSLELLQSHISPPHTRAPWTEASAPPGRSWPGGIGAACGRRGRLKTLKHTHHSAAPGTTAATAARRPHAHLTAREPTPTDTRPETHRGGGAWPRSHRQPMRNQKPEPIRSRPASTDEGRRW